MDFTLNRPLISAIMIVYNGDRFIEKAIDSILKQTYEDFELLILNDGSTDNTELIIKQKQQLDNRIIYLHNSENKGLSFSRNKIINSAKGNFIIVTDADDMCFENRFETQINFMLKNPHIDIYGSNVTLINEADKIFDDWKYPLTNSEIKTGLLNSCVIANPSSIFKKEVFLKIGGYDETLTICEDWDFFVRASHYFKFENSNNSKIYYRIHNNNISKSKLERTVLYALYLKHNLPKTCLNIDIKLFLNTYPHLKNELSLKAIQFYCYWIETYFSMGYKNSALNLINFMASNFYTHFNTNQKRLYNKNIINTCLNYKEYKLLIITLKNYLV